MRRKWRPRSGWRRESKEIRVVVVIHGAESDVSIRSAATTEVVLNGSCGGVGSVWDFVAGYVRFTLRFTRFRFGSFKVQSTAKVWSTDRLGSTGQPVRVKRLGQTVQFVVRVDSVKPSQLGQLIPGQLNPRFDARDLVKIDDTFNIYVILIIL
ncbi:hypothetical protein Hanom_Chr12g01137071 [Helianthus anomalus]